jgi:hypothetical protein
MSPDASFGLTGRAVKDVLLFSRRPGDVSDNECYRARAGVAAALRGAQCAQAINGEASQAKQLKQGAPWGRRVRSGVTGSAQRLRANEHRLSGWAGDLDYSEPR